MLLSYFSERLGRVTLLRAQWVGCAVRTKNRRLTLVRTAHLTSSGRRRLNATEYWGMALAWASRREAQVVSEECGWDGNKADFTG